MLRYFYRENNFKVFADFIWAFLYFGMQLFRVSLIDKNSENTLYQSLNQSLNQSLSFWNVHQIRLSDIEIERWVHGPLPQIFLCVLLRDLAHIDAKFLNILSTQHVTVYNCINAYKVWCSRFIALMNFAITAN